MPKQVSIEAMVDAIRKAEKPLTEGEIGDRSDHARRTVANYRDELKAHPEVGHGKVGKANAYWYVGDDEGREEEARTPGTSLVKGLFSLAVIYAVLGLVLTFQGVSPLAGLGVWGAAVLLALTGLVLNWGIEEGWAPGWKVSVSLRVSGQAPTEVTR